MNIALRYAARSDVGLVRSNNQDSAYAGPHLLVVADGMGGHAGGDVASSIAIAALAPLDASTHSPDHALAELEETVDEARQDLVDRSNEDPALTGMGTTVTALMRVGADRLAMAHLGDSRAYLLRDGELTQVTTDHTFVQHLVDTGRILPEEAETHPQRNVVMRVLGDFDIDLTPDTSIREAKPGDRWMLCSDGLSGFVHFEMLENVLDDIADVDECADHLLNLALMAGSTDNVTVIVADVVDLDQQPGTTAPSDLVQVVGSAANDRTGPIEVVPAPPDFLLDDRVPPPAPVTVSPVSSVPDDAVPPPGTTEAPGTTRAEAVGTSPGSATAAGAAGAAAKNAAAANEQPAGATGETTTGTTDTSLTDPALPARTGKRTSTKGGAGGPSSANGSADGSASDAPADASGSSTGHTPTEPADAAAGNTTAPAANAAPKNATADVTAGAAGKTATDRPATSPDDAATADASNDQVTARGAAQPGRRKGHPSARQRDDITGRWATTGATTNTSWPAATGSATGPHVTEVDPRGLLDEDLDITIMPGQDHEVWPTPGQRLTAERDKAQEQRAADLRTLGGTGTPARADATSTDDEPVVLEVRPSRRRDWIWTASIAALVLSIVVAGWAGYRWTQSQYFVGISDGQVAVFRGVNASAGPLDLSKPVYLTGTSVEDLRPSDLDRLKQTISAGSLAEARERANDLASMAQTPEPSPTASGTPSPTPSNQPTTEPTATPSATNPAPTEGTPGAATPAAGGPVDPATGP